jgi:hypothetical protein
MSLPFKLAADLTLSLTAPMVRLTPDQALDAAKQFLRKGTLAMMQEAAGLPIGRGEPRRGAPLAIARRKSR